MEKDFMYNDYTGDSVINRGYKIYDEWKAKRLSSRKIVAYVERAVFNIEQNKSKAASINALSCLFALDLRVTEKYDTFWKCLVHYFSWRSENGALKRLKVSFHISDDEDIRTAIEIELQRLRENIETDESEEGDDETHGGKRNGKSEEEAATTEEKEAEETAEEKNEAEELADKEEKEKDSEQIEEEPIENAQQEEAKEDISEKKETAEIQQEEAEMTATEEKEELVQEKNENLKEENNVSDVESEPSTDKKEEAKSYNDAVDSPPLYEETVSERKTEKTSFIDEMIIDNMVKGDKDAMGYTSVEVLKQNNEADRPQNTVVSQNEENKSTEKDAHLYDKTLANDKGETRQLGKTESTHQTENTSEIKTEQPKEEIQKNDSVQSNEKESKPIRETLKVDINVEHENNVAKELNQTMSIESKLAYIRMQEDMFREQISISNKELGIDVHADVLEITEPVQITQPSVAQNIK